MLNDFRFAIRQLWKSPGFTLAAVTVLALGIGVNTAIFTLVNQMLFQPPAYSRPNEIVQLFSQDANNPKSFRSFSYPIYRDIREQNTVFAVGKSILNRSCHVKVGDLLLKYGGGGHDAAGTCQIANDSADETLKEIVALFGSGTISSPKEPVLV